MLGCALWNEPERTAAVVLVVVLVGAVVAVAHEGEESNSGTAERSEGDKEEEVENAVRNW